MNNKKNLKFSLISFLYYSQPAFALAFIPLYCKHLSFSAEEIALTTSAIDLGTVFGTLFFSHYLLKYFSAKLLLPKIGLLRVITLLPLLFISSFYLFLFFWLLNCLLSRAANYLLEVQALQLDHDRKLSFSLVRSIGSGGFVVITFFSGLALEKYGIYSSLLLFLSATVLFYLCCFSIVKEFSEINYSKHDALVESGRTPRIVYFITFLYALSWLSHGGYYVYFSIYLKSLGWDGNEIALAWNIGVLAEILLFLSFAFLKKHFSLERIIQLSLLLTVLRWLIIYACKSKYILFFSQILHAATFGSLYLASLQLIFAKVSPRKRDKGQGILIGVGAGFGTFCGRIVFGYLAGGIEQELNFNNLFLYSAVFAGVAFVLSIRLKVEKKLTP